MLATVVGVTAVVGIAAAPAGAMVPTIDVTTTDDVVDPNDGVVSLREAVLLAASTVGPERVRLVPGADYTLECPAGPAEDLGASGDLDHHVGDVLTVAGRGATLSYAVSCPGHRLLDSGPLVLRDLTLKDSRGLGDGGALRSTGPVFVYDSLFLGNSSIAGSGGAIDSPGHVVVRRSRFEGNEAAVVGGAIRADGVTIADCEFAGNRANYDGGALRIGASPSRISRTTFDRNETLFGRGGALFGFPTPELSLTDSWFEANSVQEHAVGGGGAVYLHGELVVRRSTFVDNWAEGVLVGGQHSGGNGGAIYSRGSVRIHDSHLRGNRAGEAGHGGAVYSVGEVRLLDSELRGNQSGGVGGAVAAAAGAGPAVDFTGRRLLVAANRAGHGGGGLWVHGGGEVLLADSAVTGNEAVEGWAVGGGLLLEGSVRLVRSDISGNVAGSVGAGVYLDANTDATLVETTVTANWGNDLPGVAGPGLGTTTLGGDLGFIHDNLGIVTAEIGGVIVV